MAFFFMKKRQNIPQSTKSDPVQKNEEQTVPNHTLAKRAAKLIKSPVLILNDNKPVYAFIDASNLFWGGKESIGFKIDYAKLYHYLQKNFKVAKAFYYGGIRIFDFEYSVLENKPLDLAKLTEHLTKLKDTAESKDVALIEKSLSKVHFYQLLESYGYIMKIKPAKVFYDEDDENQERPILKANCDVDMTFDIMRYMQQYSGVVALTGDGDFTSVLSYLKYHNRKLTVVSRWDRTAKEIRILVGDDFVDFEKLRPIVQYR